MMENSNISPIGGGLSATSGAMASVALSVLECEPSERGGGGDLSVAGCVGDGGELRVARGRELGPDGNRVTGEELGGINEVHDDVMHVVNHVLVPESSDFVNDVQVDSVACE
ncbi:hypothetical protein Dimus_004281, partial [Dionaea muscipula]